MGTNFYARKILTRERKNELKKFVEDNMPSYEELCNKIEENDICYLYTDINQFGYMLEEKLKEIGYEVHLGKRSYGWQFLWQYYDGLYYKDNLQSIAQFLNSGEYEVYDEYGEKFTTEQFLEDEIKDCLYKDENHCDLRQYYHKDPPKYEFEWNYCDREWQSKDGLRFVRGDFS